MFNHIMKYTSRQMKPKEQSKGNIHITSMFNNMNSLGWHRSVRGTKVQFLSLYTYIAEKFEYQIKYRFKFTLY